MAPGGSGCTAQHACRAATLAARLPVPPVATLGDVYRSRSGASVCAAAVIAAAMLCRLVSRLTTTELRRLLLCRRCCLSLSCSALLLPRYARLWRRRCGCGCWCAGQRGAAAHGHLRAAAAAAALLLLQQVEAAIPCHTQQRARRAVLAL